MGSVKDFKPRETTVGLPHDLDAEMGLLGALLYENANLELIEDLLTEESFYEPLHGKIYAAAREAVSRGRRADPVTVNHALLHETALADAGGIDYLADLVELTTASRSCHEYATVIQELWRRRELIKLGESVAKQARGGEVSVKVIEHNERAILSLQVHGAGLRLVGADEAISSVIEEYENAERGAGVKLGLSPIDDETGGFMKGEMWCAAGRPSMGKSALAATAALNIARNGYAPSGARLGVIEISCEMRVEQLMRRHIADLCYELYGSGAPSYSIIRRRLMTEQQRKMFYTAAAGLRELGTLKSIYRTGLTISSLRSLIRRQMGQWARQGIETGLVIVDHMGLVRDAGQSRNRHEQQGEVARDTKEMAGDLDIPLLALLQLNRKVEERDDKRPMLADLRDCVTGETLVTLADGRRVPISDLAGTRNIAVISPDGAIAEAEAWEVGTREVVEVQLRSGRRVRCTGRHRLRGASGWVRVQDLVLGSRIAVLRTLPEPPDPTSWPDERVAFLGQMIGDGCYVHGSSPGYVSADPENIAAVEAGAASFGAIVHRYESEGKVQLSLSCNGNRWEKGPLIDWFESMGIRDQRSGTKRVPPAAFMLPNRQISLLLRHLWATDGHIGFRAISYTSKSEGLARDIMDLLVRVGVASRLSFTIRDSCFRVTVRDGDAGLFADRVGAFGPRVEPLRRLMGKGLKTNTNVDTLPAEFTAHVRTILKERGISHRRFAQLCGIAFNGNAQWKGCWGWHRALRAAAILKHPQIQDWVNPQYFWDQVVAIGPPSHAMVYDICVPGPESWIANGIVSHNSGEWEQNADGVIGCYRDAYYAEREREPKRQDEKILWEERKASRWMEALFLKIREGQTQTVKLWTDMARNAIRGGVPESYYEGDGTRSFDFTGALAEMRRRDALLDPDQKLLALSPDAQEFS